MGLFLKGRFANRPYAYRKGEWL